jgi:hypothetical protein
MLSIVVFNVLEQIRNFDTVCDKMQDFREKYASDSTGDKDCELFSFIRQKYGRVFPHDATVQKQILYF